MSKCQVRTLDIGGLSASWAAQLVVLGKPVHFLATLRRGGGRLRPLTPLSCARFMVLENERGRCFVPAQSPQMGTRTNYRGFVGYEIQILRMPQVFSGSHRPQFSWIVSLTTGAGTASVVDASEGGTREQQSSSCFFSKDRFSQATPCRCSRRRVYSPYTRLYAPDTKNAPTEWYPLFPTGFFFSGSEALSPRQHSTTLMKLFLFLSPCVGSVFGVVDSQARDRSNDDPQ